MVLFEYQRSSSFCFMWPHCTVAWARLPPPPTNVSTKLTYFTNTRTFSLEAERRWPFLYFPLPFGPTFAARSSKACTQLYKIQVAKKRILGWCLSQTSKSVRKNKVWQELEACSHGNVFDGAEQEEGAEEGKWCIRRREEYLSKTYLVGIFP